MGCGGEGVCGGEGRCVWWGKGGVVGEGRCECVGHDRTTLKYAHTFPQYGACMALVCILK